MNIQEYLITSLNEEASEVAQQASKTLRFGIDDVYTTVKEDGGHILHDSPSNRFRLIEELNDLMGIVELLVEQGALPADWMSRDRIKAKKKKVIRYMKYAREVGSLRPGPEELPFMNRLESSAGR